MDSDSKEVKARIVKLTIEEIVPLADEDNEENLKAKAVLIANGRHEYLIRDGMLRIAKVEVVENENK